MAPEIIYFIAGALAAGLRALLPDQVAYSRKTVVDMVSGGFAGVLVPFAIEMKVDWHFLTKAAIVFLPSFLCGDLLRVIGMLIPGLGPLLSGKVEAKAQEAALAARERVEATEGKR